MEYKKKLTDIFLRKQQKSKKESLSQKQKVLEFDESYFQAQLVCDNIHTTLMKITAEIKKGPNQGQQIPLKCKWYTKNQFDFKEIQDVKTPFYQPCLQDVGNVICVQIQPYIQGMNYTGITIMKESNQLKMDKKLENLSNDYFLSRHFEMEGKIQVMYSQNPIYEKYQFPLEVAIVLRERNVQFISKGTKQIVAEYQITQDFPQVDFIKKTFNSILFTCTQNESMKLSLSNNLNRDLFSLIVRSIPSRLSISSQQQQLPQIQLSSSPIRAKSQIQHHSQQTTKFILRIDELNKQLKNMKRINEQLSTNYHLQRNAKINLQNEVQRLKIILQKTNEQHKQCKPLHTKIKQVLQENKFYFGELALMKSQIKDKNNSIKEIKAELTKTIVQKQLLEKQIQKLISVPKNIIQQLQKELANSRSLNEQYQLENQSLKQKINELQNQKNLLKKKVNSIVSEKSLPSTPMKSGSKISSLEDLTPAKDKDIQIKDLKMQITNLEMLLKHKSGQKGGQMISMHFLVNSLTQKIAQKQLEIQTLKRINKQLSKNVSSFSLTQIN